MGDRAATISHRQTQFRAGGDVCLLFLVAVGPVFFSLDRPLVDRVEVLVKLSRASPFHVLEVLGNEIRGSEGKRNGFQSASDPRVRHYVFGQLWVSRCDGLQVKVRRPAGGQGVAVTGDGDELQTSEDDLSGFA